MLPSSLSANKSPSYHHHYHSYRKNSLLGDSLPRFALRMQRRLAPTTFSQVSKTARLSLHHSQVLGLCLYITNSFSESRRIPRHLWCRSLTSLMTRRWSTTMATAIISRFSKTKLVLSTQINLIVMKIELETMRSLTKTFRRLADSRGLVTSPGLTSHQASSHAGGVRLLQPG